MKMIPTREDIDKEHNLYAEYLEHGGKPIQIILEMRPGKGDTIDWNVIPVIPDDLPNLGWLAMFVGWIKGRVTEALKPPTQLKEGQEIEQPKRK